MSLSFETFWFVEGVKTKTKELGHRLNFMDSSSSSSAASVRPMRPNDLESNANSMDSKKGSLVRVWRVPVPVRKGYITSDLFKNLFLIMALLCIAEFVYIQRIRSGLIRIDNDPYDIRFGQRINHASPEIWDFDRQDFIRNAVPVPVHSHNDYWRRIPLFEALGSGCISIEADVHLKDDELYVAHTSFSMQTKKKSTLKELYLAPLEKILRERNANTSRDDWRGIYDQAPKQTLVLLVDHKTSGLETLVALDEQLQSLRDLDFLSYWNGTDRVMRPLTIVATGNAPFDAILDLTSSHRDIFFDAPLEQLWFARGDDLGANPPVYRYNISNSYFASTRWQNARLWHWHDPSKPEPQTTWEKELESSQLELAQERGLITRYWDTPSGPPNLVEIVWRVLVERKVGLVNMDDLGAVRARARGWGRIEL